MTTKVPGLEYDEKALAELCRRWHIRELRLFGSRARGEARPDSDVDLMVTFQPGRAPSLWDFVTMQQEAEDLFKRDVDLVIEGAIENPIRRRSIERDLTVIYAT